MKTIIISATGFETAITKKTLQAKHKKNVSFFVTGIGLLPTAINLTKIILEQKPDYIIQAGIAGCFNTNESLGKVYVIEKEFLGDSGVIENNQFKDLFDLKLMTSSVKPFSKKALANKNIATLNLTHLPVANAVSVNEITTEAARILQLQKKYNPTLESMEGAALHYAGNLLGVKYLQIRSTSNYIGERDKAKWKMKKSIGNLNKELKKIIAELNKL